MGVTTRERRYGDFEWITIGDSAASKDTITKRETSEEAREKNRQAVQKHRRKVRRKEESRKKRNAKARMYNKGMVMPIIETRGPQTPLDEGQGGIEGKKKPQVSWYTVTRNRWRNVCVQARKQGIDGLPWDAYKELWKAAGQVEPPWGGMVDADKLQDHNFSKRRRALLIRFDTSKGYKPGNTGVVLVEGLFRNFKRPDVEPDIYQELSVWATNGDILDREGTVVGRVDP